MAYADLTYYKTTYGGRSIVDAETTVWLERASDDVDIATNYSITEEDLSLWQLTLVKKAVCAQAEYFVTNGAEYNEGSITSAGIGKFNYSGEKKSKPGGLSSRALAYLSQTGLMFAGVDVAGGQYFV